MLTPPFYPKQDDACPGQPLDDEDDGDDATGPVRKGTLSKDLGHGQAGYTMASVMSKINTIALIVVLTPPIVIIANMTGEKH